MQVHLTKRSPWLKRITFGMITLLLIGVGLWKLQAESVDQEKANQPPRKVRYGVSCIGRIEPKDRVIQVAANSSMEPPCVHKICVKEGDHVELSTRLAILDCFSRRESAVGEAKARVAVAKAKLDQVKAGAKAGDIASHEAAVQRMETALQHAERELRRGEDMRSRNAMAAEDVEMRRLTWMSNKMQLQQAKASLDSIKEIRTVDVFLAEAEVLSAKSALLRAEEDLLAAQVFAPIAGTVLKIHSRNGEKVGDKGILEMGDVRSMYVVAEVYEADILKVQSGQVARIKLPSMATEVKGEVETVGFLIGRRLVLNNDPVSDTDARVSEVRIRIAPEDSPKTVRLSNARVHVTIETIEAEKK